MPNERVVEIPWAMAQLPEAGRVLDVGSCDATYLQEIARPGRELHSLDPRGRPDALPPGVGFHRENLIGCRLPRLSFDAVLVLSVLEHVGLPAYGNAPLDHGDRRALLEIAGLLRPGGRLVVTVPAGRSRLVSWFRQYSPSHIARLFSGWRVDVRYWLLEEDTYRTATADEVSQADYHLSEGRAGAVAGIVATLPAN
jgi:SAM-dependent methyltransferase